MVETKTKVIFRRWKDEDKSVFALFPEEPGTNDPYTCSSYAHIGQHSSADPYGCMNRSFPAHIGEKDTKALYDELKRIGYDLEIVFKNQKSYLNARRSVLSVFGE